MLSSSLETHRSALGLWKQLRSRRAATLLSMRARARGAFWPNEANASYSARPREGHPAAGTHDHCRWLWVPALAALGRDDNRLVCAKHQPAAVRNDRRGTFIVSGLLFTMTFATPTCRLVECARFLQGNTCAGVPSEPLSHSNFSSIARRFAVVSRGVCWCAWCAAKRTGPAEFKALLRAIAVGSSIHTRVVVRRVCAPAAISSESF